MKFKRGHSKCWYAVFKDEPAAERWAWLFYKLMRRPMACFNGYYNAWQLW